MATEQYLQKDLDGHGSDPEKATPHSPQLSSAASSDLDDNYVLYKQHENEAPADAAEAKSVLRKIACCLSYGRCTCCNILTKTV
jgi:hypothetical protein